MACHEFPMSNIVSRPALTWCLDALELAAYICVCSTVAEIVQAANIQCRFWSRCWEVGEYSSSLWPSLLVQLWLDHNEGTWGQRRRRRLTRSTKHRSSFLFSPSLPVALQSGWDQNSSFWTETRPMPLSLIMVQIKTGPIHLRHYQSHLTVHNDHIVWVLAKPFANLFIFFFQENKDRRALKA